MVDGSDAPVHNAVFLLEGLDIVGTMKVMLTATVIRPGVRPQFTVNLGRVPDAAPLG